MSLLGVDVGTTGCKAAVFSHEGDLIAAAYQEYDARRPEPGWAEFDALEVWKKVKHTIKEVVHASAADPVKALAVSSLGEAMVPVTQHREILGPSIVANFDLRGEEYVQILKNALGDLGVYQINGNTPGPNYSLPKLMWIKQHRPELYRATFKFLLWGSFVPFMLGAEPAVDYSLANRTLLLDIARGDWSDEILDLAAVDRAKLPKTVPSGTVVGQVSQRVAEDLGLMTDVAIVAGAHDQCANAVGCGVIKEGRAVYSLGTFACITPVFCERREPTVMIERGLNTEHHAVSDKFVCFIYNQGGSLVKWYRDTFAAMERLAAESAGHDIYAALFSEIPEGPSPVMVLPHFSTTGPPRFISDSCGVLVGLRLDTSREEILKGILEGTTFYLKECVDMLPATGIDITDFRMVGGGSKSDAWIQICADIMGRACVRPQVIEAGTLGAAIIAGVGSGAFPSFEAGVDAMVRLDRIFEPAPRVQALYRDRFGEYKQLWPLMGPYLRGLARD